MESDKLEHSIIGSMVNEYAEVRHLIEDAGVSSEMFSDSTNRSLFIHCDEAKAAGSCNALSVVDAMVKSGGWGDRWEAQQYVELCMEDAAFPWDVPSHCQILKDRWAARRMKTECQVAQSMIADNRAVGEAINHMSSTINMLTENLAASRDRDSIDAVTSRAVAQWEKIHKGGNAGIPSSWNAVNEYIGSWMYGDAHVIGAYRDTGKTFVMTNEVVHSAVMLPEPVPTCIVSLDMRTEQVAQRMLSQLAEFSTFVMDTGRGSHHMESAAEAKAKLDRAPIHFYSGPGDIRRILNTLRVYVQKYGVKSVWIDYFQRLSMGGKHASRNAELEYIVRSICDFLGEHEVSGMILSQFNRSSEQQERQPRLSDLKDCGSLEQDARKVILISRTPETARSDNIYDWEIAKNNTGPTGTVQMRRVANRARWDVHV